ncbi:MAG: hypothetical protein M1826_000748 [Phylliscum demangeonii]|nr:MAG: hypothetical protein M1826_000748 [Phylliscum demangeonii]
MRYRRFSIVVASTLIASGAVVYYENTRTDPVAAAKGSRPLRPSQPTSTSTATSSAVSESPASSRAGSVYGAAPALAAEEPEADERRRQAVIVADDQFYVRDILGDGPLRKSSDDAGRKVLEMMTPEQATRKLRRNEESYLVGRGRGVVRYDMVQIASNDPIEDDHSEKIVEIPASVAATHDQAPHSDWMFWGVYDGHSGWTTSAKLRQVLISFVARELITTYRAAVADAVQGLPTPESIDGAIKRGFVRLDDEIVHGSVEQVLKTNSRRTAAERLAPALSGACALLSFYDSASQTLRVACTGDSRAVLGRRGPHGGWTATALSVDQTGAAPAEVARLRREHPGEAAVVQHGRVLGGLEPSRAFGDGSYKWTRATQERLKASFFGRTPSRLLRTPPYVTAEPVVTTTRMEPGRGDFVVLATDGLWEMLSNDEVVGLVGQWLDAQLRAGRPPSAPPASWLGQLFRRPPSATSPAASRLPVEPATTTAVEAGADPKSPIRPLQWGVPTTPNASARFVLEDQNAATHLVRNALGGRDRDTLCALLTLPSPYARRYRDDLTVQVIFFGEGEGEGEPGESGPGKGEPHAARFDIVVNPDATASGTAAKL